MWRVFYNAVDYRLRQAARWRRGGLRYRNEDKSRLFDSLPEPGRGQARAAADRLLAAYDLSGFHADSQARNYCEALFYLELLERTFEAAGVELGNAVEAADIGTSHWFYVQTLYALLRRWRRAESRQVRLTGYEADAYRVYADLHSRYDHALAHMRDLPVTFVPAAFSAQPGAFDLITMLFPFVFAADHMQWGLPEAVFKPEQLLRSAWASLKPGGWLVVVNQGEAEHAAQRAMLEGAGAAPAAAFRHDSVLFPYDIPRFVLAARRS